MDDATFVSEEHGIDLEAEVAVITDDVPMLAGEDAARDHIKLLMLVNDWSLRNLIPGELAKGFGFYQSKPASAFSPVAVTPDELGTAWDGGKVNLPLIVEINGAPFGKPEAGVDMTFDFPTLISHVTKTRNARAGTIVGSGTISNYDRSRGSACIAERRTLELIEQGKPVTPFLKFGDRVRIEWYNTERLHSALGYLRPMDYYRGDPATLHEARRRKIAEARHRRRETNLKLRQPTLPLEPMESIANKKPGMSHCG